MLKTGKEIWYYVKCVVTLTDNSKRGRRLRGLQSLKQRRSNERGVEREVGK